jgi:hypothetical protein
MVISFLGGKQGRILQAYYDSKILIIQKTKFYDFFTVEAARPHIEHFLRYMASEAIGETKSFPMS